MQGWSVQAHGRRSPSTTLSPWGDNHAHCSLTGSPTVHVVPHSVDDTLVGEEEGVGITTGHLPELGHMQPAERMTLLWMVRRGQWDDGYMMQCGWQNGMVHSDATCCREHNHGDALEGAFIMSPHSTHQALLFLSRL